MNTTRRLAAVAAIAATALTVAACGGSKPHGDPAACKSAMAKAYASATASPNGLPGC